MTRLKYDITDVLRRADSDLCNGDLAPRDYAILRIWCAAMDCPDSHNPTKLGRTRIAKRLKLTEYTVRIVQMRLKRLYFANFLHNK